MARVHEGRRNLFEAKNSDVLRAWYAKNSGIVSEGGKALGFRRHPPDSSAKANFTSWCIFRFRSVFLAPDLMVSHVVNDLRAVPGALREEGVSVGLESSGRS